MGKKAVVAIALVGAAVATGGLSAAASGGAWGAAGGLGSIGTVGVVGGGLSFGTALQIGGLAMQGYSKTQERKYQKQQSGFQRDQVTASNKAGSVRKKS